MVLAVCSHDLRNPCNDQILSSSSRVGCFTDALCQKHIKILIQYQHTLLSKFNGVNLSDTEQSIIRGKKGRFRPQSAVEILKCLKWAPQYECSGSRLFSKRRGGLSFVVIQTSNAFMDNLRQLRKCILQQINLNSCLMYAGSNSDQSITITTHTPTTKPYDSII
jgi:hypothetical protein